MPALAIMASECKKDDNVVEESEAETDHDRGAEDAMSESSRWSGETVAPRETPRKILDNDEERGGTPKGRR